MSGLTTSELAARAHAPLVQRAAAILGSSGGTATLRGKGEPVQPGPGPSVLLERGAINALRREGQRGHFALTYRDPTSDAALAALIAAASAAGLPIAADPETLSILALADRLAASEIPVLINGPTGTGKEVLSRFIHARSPRRDKAFVAVNCAAMPEAMLEALLFGHKKGAFTGASEANEGFFRAADGGTLLLDANRDLPTEVAEGRFRADLFYRLNVFPLALRPLRERTEDIAPLAFALVLRHSAPGKPIPWISDSALAMLKLHGWPGNVRELENVVRRALLLADGRAEIGTGEIVFDQPARLVGDPGSLPEPDHRLSNIVQISEAKAIMQTLDACRGNRIAAARQLGISERTLRYRLAAFREAGLAVAGARR